MVGYLFRTATPSTNYPRIRIERRSGSYAYKLYGGAPVGAKAWAGYILRTPQRDQPNRSGDAVLRMLTACEEHQDHPASRHEVI